MTDVPLPECLPKPEEPKAAEPQQSPQQLQFQQVPPNYYQFPPQGYYPPQGFPNYPPQPMPYFPNPWLFQQAPPQQFQFQSQSKRDQDFEEGLNRLRKEYATAPMEDDRLSVPSLKSTDSTRTTDSVRDREDYLKQSETLHPTTIYSWSSQEHAQLRRSDTSWRPQNRRTRKSRPARQNKDGDSRLHTCSLPLQV
ncbi:hypothetical protein TVAGG3_1032530, partial [Trichomonas vaginalis G3]|uniref:hypothetical protein n=1 Tax=Trichomonas vaginalis (strain ATCC PRA-98 / G3) TaxID=412133 RepID=UPI0021E61F23